MRSERSLVNIFRTIAFLVAIAVATGCATNRATTTLASTDDSSGWVYSDDSWKTACSEYSFIGF